MIKVSVIIATKNEEKNIERCIKSILSQNFPQKHIEIIVVDNNSTDRTKEFALGCTKKVYNYGPERSAQRNYGSKKALGKYFFYLDADMSLHKNVIGEAVEKLEIDKKIVGLYIPEIIVGRSFWVKVRRFERIFYNQTVVDCIRFMRIKAFYKVGGFDERLSGPEDWDLDKKMRNEGQVAIINSSLYHHEDDFNIREYVNKKKYYMKSFNSYIKKWGNTDKDIKKQFSFFYRYIDVFIENGKWILLIRHPILTLGLVFLRFLVGINFMVIRYRTYHKRGPIIFILNKLQGKIW